MRRLILCVGDAPETGGHIVPMVVGVSHQIMGHNVAFIGAQAFCKECKSIGIVSKAGGPARRLHSGIEIALDADILLCRCSSPPRMIASTQHISWHDDLVEAMGDVPMPVGRNGIGAKDGLSSEQADEDLERYFEIVDAKTDTPIEGMTYNLLSDGQAVVYDATLAGGRTRAFSVKDHPDLAFVAWREGDVR